MTEKLQRSEISTSLFLCNVRHLLKNSVLTSLPSYITDNRFRDTRIDKNGLLRQYAEVLLCNEL